MDGQKEVVSMIKSCIILQKGGMPIPDLEREYRDMVGSNIPYKALGHASLKEFLQSIPEVYSTGTSTEGAFVLQVRDEKIQHIQDLVSQQKSPKKRTKKKYTAGNYGRPNFYSEHRKNTSYSKSKSQCQNRGYNSYQSVASSRYQSLRSYNENISARKPCTQNSNCNTHSYAQKETQNSSQYRNYNYSASSAMLTAHSTTTRKEKEPYACNKNNFEEELPTNVIKKQNMLDLSTVETRLIMQNQTLCLKNNTTYPIKSDIQVEAVSQSHNEAKMPDINSFNRHIYLNNASRDEKLYPVPEISKHYIHRTSQQPAKHQIDLNQKEQTDFKRNISEISINKNEPHKFVPKTYLSSPDQSTESVTLKIPNYHIRKFVPYQSLNMEAYNLGQKSHVILPPPGFSLLQPCSSVTQDPLSFKKQEICTESLFSLLNLSRNNENPDSGILKLKEKSCSISQVEVPCDINCFKTQCHNESFITIMESTTLSNDDTKAQITQGLPSEMEIPDYINMIFNHQLIGDDFFVKLCQVYNSYPEEELCISGLSIADCLKKVKSVPLHDQVLVLVGCVDILQDMPLKTMQILMNLLIQELSKKVKRAVFCTLPPLFIQDLGNQKSISNKYNTFNKWLLQKTEIIIVDLHGAFWDQHGPIRSLLENNFHQVEGVDKSFSLWNNKGIAAFIDIVTNCDI